jgi:hypothetical protein
VFAGKFFSAGEKRFLLDLPSRSRIEALTKPAELYKNDIHAARGSAGQLVMAVIPS